MGLQFNRLDTGIHHFRYRDRPQVEVQFAGFNQGQFRQVVRQPLEPEGMFENDLQEFPIVSAISQGAAEEGFGKSVDCCQGRLEFVRDIWRRNRAGPAPAFGVR